MAWRARKPVNKRVNKPEITISVGTEVLIKRSAHLYGGKSGTIIKLDGVEHGQQTVRVAFKIDKRFVVVRYSRDDILEPKGMAWEGNALEKAQHKTAVDNQFKLMFNGQTWS